MGRGTAQPHGELFHTAGGPGAILSDAVMCVRSAWGILTVRRPEPQPASGASASTERIGLGSGVAVSRKHPSFDGSPFSQCPP